MDAYKMQLFIYSNELVQAIQWDPDNEICKSLDCVCCIASGDEGEVYKLEAAPSSRDILRKGDWIVFREDSSRQILHDAEFTPRVEDITEVNAFLRAKIRPQRKDRK